MRHWQESLAGMAVLLLAAPAFAPAQPPAAPFKPPDTIAHRTANVMSEGVRLSAELYALKENAGKRLPTVILCHGWGGTAAQLRREALDFARAGYLAITFDYRGWGASDARVILTAAAPARKEGGRFTAEVQEVREVVDPFEQTDDVFN